MTKLQKIVLWATAVIAVMLLCAAVAPKGSKVGGVYNQAKQYFYEGISVGNSNEFAIDSDGDVTSSGSFTNSGAVSLGSTSAGVNLYNPIVTPTADASVTASQTGSIFNLGTAGVDLTLPSAADADGAHYKFVVSAAFATTSITIVTASGADEIEGSLIVAGAVVDCDAEDTISFVHDGENIGDFVELFSNGTDWIIGASGGLTSAKLTCTGS